MTVSELTIGEEAEIIGFKDNGFGLVIREMGFLEGVCISLVSKAPFGDPVCIANGETLLSIRVKDAHLIQVKKLS